MQVKFENILFPTDFSDLSLVALHHARKLVGAFSSRLHCLHVVDEAYQYWSAMGPESVPVGPPVEELLESARNRITRFRDEHLADLTPEPTTHVILGRPFAEIIAYARQNDIDLIVMGTHGRGALVQMLLGSTTEKVVRKASAAVLTVRAPGHDFIMP